MAMCVNRHYTLYPILSESDNFAVPLMNTLCCLGLCSSADSRVRGTGPDTGLPWPAPILFALGPKP